MVVSELDRLRADTGVEVLKLKAEFDADGTEAKMATINDLIVNLGAQSQDAFMHLAAVEASLQTHVNQGFAEAVAALVWLNDTTESRFAMVETKLLQVEAAVGSAAPLVLLYRRAGGTAILPPP